MSNTLMNLYQFEFGSESHYVVAESFAEAESLIAAADYSPPGRIENLGEYVLVSPNAIANEESSG